ncbi:MAG: DUF3322 domain-containing protein [Cyclobacteriaceae bacterium]
MHKKEFGRFHEDVALILREFPTLQAYLQSYPRCVIEHHGGWQDIVTVCKWFAIHHQPHTYYIRELPIPVHTKFIEEKKGISHSLLDEVAPQAVCPEDKDFAVRFGLPLQRKRSTFSRPFCVYNISVFKPQSPTSPAAYLSLHYYGQPYPPKLYLQVYSIWL